MGPTLRKIQFYDDSRNSSTSCSAGRLRRTVGRERRLLAGIKIAGQEWG